MTNKVVITRDGDKWSKLGNFLWLYRGDRCWAVEELGHCIDEIGGGSIASNRYPEEIDISTSEAHAILRKWGYEIRPHRDNLGSMLDKLLAETMNNQWQFECPCCASSHFGTNDTNGIYKRLCHDQFQRGCRWSGSDSECNGFRPSTNISHAMQAADKFTDYSLEKAGNGYEFNVNGFSARHNDKCIAICIGILLATGVSEEKIKESMYGK